MPTFRVPQLDLPEFRLPEGWEERFAAGTRALQELLTVMAPHGWLVPLSYTLRETSDMLSTYRRYGPEAVEARLIDDFRHRSAAKAVAQLGREPATAPWLHVLTMAAGAHDRGEWPLAIPIWLMATEGLVGQHGLGIVDPYSIQNPESRRARRVQERLAPRGSIAPPSAKALVTIFAALSRSSSDPAVLSRHTVLHGCRPMVGDERDSIQCFFTLDVLACLV